MPRPKRDLGPGLYTRLWKEDMTVLDDMEDSISEKLRAIVHDHIALREVADDLCADLTMLLIEIDEMGNAGHHVEQIRQKLDGNENLERLVELLHDRLKVSKV
jgi:hypothetical protein